MLKGGDVLVVWLYTDRWWRVCGVTVCWPVVMCKCCDCILTGGNVFVEWLCTDRWRCVGDVTVHRHETYCSSVFILSTGGQSSLTRGQHCPVHASQQPLMKTHLMRHQPSFKTVAFFSWTFPVNVHESVSLAKDHPALRSLWLSFGVLLKEGFLCGIFSILSNLHVRFSARQACAECRRASFTSGYCESEFTCARSCSRGGPCMC